MKIRTDFVTNSSSSSFIVARKGSLNEKQKEELVKYIERRFLGTEAATNISEFPQFAKDNYLREGTRKYEKTKEALEEGMSVRNGSIDQEIGEFTDDVYLEIWEILEKYSDGNFKIIDGDLSY